MTIKDILRWNNLPENYVLRTGGDKLFIAGPDSQGMFTPTPRATLLKPHQMRKVGLCTRSRHIKPVKIGEAYGVSVAELLRLNAINVDTPLQIGQKLIVKGPDHTPPTPPTPVPLTPPLQMLTPPRQMVSITISSEMVKTCSGSRICMASL